MYIAVLRNTPLVESLLLKSILLSFYAFITHSCAEKLDLKWLVEPDPSKKVKDPTHCDATQTNPWIKPTHAHLG